jgi:hypothetical protein
VDSGDAPHAGNDSGKHLYIFAGFLCWLCFCRAIDL